MLVKDHFGKRHPFLHPLLKATCFKVISTFFSKKYALIFKK